MAHKPRLLLETLGERNADCVPKPLTKIGVR